MSELVDALVASLPDGAVRTNAPVERLTRDGDGWRLEVNGEAIHARAVIVATPAKAAARLLGEVDAEAAEGIGGITSTSSAVVSLGYRRDQIGHPLDGFGFVVPFVEKRRILSGSFSSVKFAGRAPEGSVLIRVFMGGAMRPELVELADEYLAAYADVELMTLLDKKHTPETEYVARWREVMPQYEIGHLDRIEGIEARLREFDGLEVAGNWLRGVGVPMCIHTGEQAAERVAARVSAKAGRAG